MKIPSSQFQTFLPIIFHSFKPAHIYTVLIVAKSILMQNNKYRD